MGIKQTRPIKYLVFIILITAMFRPVLAQNPESRILSIAWNPTGNLIATANLNGIIQIWDAESQEMIVQLSNGLSSSNAVAWSPDGTKIAANLGEVVQIWETNTWHVLFRLEGHTNNVTSIAWSPDGSQIATVSFGGHPDNFRIWSGISGELLRAIKSPGYMYSIDWSSNGEYLVTSGGAVIEIWDAVNGEIVHQLQDQWDEVVSIDWSPDATKIASASWDNAIHIWSVETWEAERVLAGHKDLPLIVVWNLDNIRLATGGYDGTIHIWDIELDEAIEVIEIGNIIFSMDWNPDGDQLAYGGEDGLFEIISVDSLDLDGN